MYDLFLFNLVFQLFLKYLKMRGNYDLEMQEKKILESNDRIKISKFLKDLILDLKVMKEKYDKLTDGNIFINNKITRESLIKIEKSKNELMSVLKENLNVITKIHNENEFYNINELIVKSEYQESDSTLVTIKETSTYENFENSNSSEVSNLYFKTDNNISNDLINKDLINSKSLKNHQLLNKKRQLFSVHNSSKNSNSMIPLYNNISNLANSNRPKDRVYKSNIIVKCAFCKYTSKDKKKLGSFYGPFKDKGIYYYIHEYCGLFSPNIHIDNNGMLKYVIYDIHLSKTNICAFCKKVGASLKCLGEEKCGLWYHFLCAKMSKCILDFHDYLTICPAHKNQNEEYDYTPDLNSDIFCLVCDSGLDEDKILLCSECEKPYHTYCTNPPLNEVPIKDWFCDSCKKKTIKIINDS
jgi:hypothetical protein